MGKKAERLARTTQRSIRKTPLSAEERRLLQGAVYEGSPLHKRNPGDFGLTPPAAPRPDKTLCDEAGITLKREALDLFAAAVDRGLVSEASVSGFPKQLWAVDVRGRVFEAIYGGSREGRYHGYPLRKSDPFCKQVLAAWKKRP